MELMEAVKERKSVRAYKPDPVQRHLLEDIIKKALWVPSWGNTQPWEIHVIGSEILKKISNEFVEKASSGQIKKPELEMPVSWPSEHKKRYTETGRDLFNAVGIPREDTKARMNYYLTMYNFFGAPNAIYICMDKGINPHYGPFDIGAVTSCICMFAHEKGLGTCILASSVHYPDVIRKYTGIPENKIIVIGIAIGYPDTDNPSFFFKSTRDENLISWKAF
jgi:nitroreductase